MKVLQLSTWQEVCGIAGYTADLVGALEAHGIDVTVHPVNRRERKYMSDGELRADLEAFCRRARDFDLVHIQHEFAFFAPTGRRSILMFATLLGRLRSARIPTVITFHTGWPTRSLGVALRARRGPLTPRTAWRALRAVATGHLAAARLGRFLRRYPKQFRGIVHTKTGRLGLVEAGVPARSIHVLPVGVALRGAAAAGISPVSAKRQLGYADDTVLLSIFGFVSRYKGYDVALRALRHLPANHHLAIIGGVHPEELATVKADRTMDNILAWLERWPDVKARVHITGFVDHATIDLYQAATDVCLAPYHPVPGMAGSASITWALASDRPVIATRIPIFVEINEAADCLLLISDGAGYELAWSVVQATTDPALRDRLVKNALGYAKTHAWPRIAERVVSVYREVLDGRAPPR